MRQPLLHSSPAGIASTPFELQDAAAQNALRQAEALSAEWTA